MSAALLGVRGILGPDAISELPPAGLNGLMRPAAGQHDQAEAVRLAAVWVGRYSVGNGRQLGLAEEPRPANLCVAADALARVAHQLVAPWRVLVGHALEASENIFEQTANPVGPDRHAALGEAWWRASMSTLSMWRPSAPIARKISRSIIERSVAAIAAFPRQVLMRNSVRRGLRRSALRAGPACRPRHPRRDRRDA